jgi:hypothetical protein
MIIYFNGFWPGFMDSMDPVDYRFFLDLFGRIFNTTCVCGNNIQEADILVESMFGGIQLIGMKQWKYAFYYSGENYVPNDPRYTAVFGGSTKYENCVKIPQILSYMYCNNLITKFLNPVPQTRVPSKIACSIISNPKSSVRNRFIQRLEYRGIRVDNGGRYKNNIGGAISGTYNSPEVVSFFQDHKFAITMENSYDEYYITEKICHGLHAGVIPIYWGTPRVSEYINGERILQLHDESDEAMDTLIDRMLSITDSEYLEIVNKPILVQADMYEQIVEDIQRYMRYKGFLRHTL